MAKRQDWHGRHFGSRGITRREALLTGAAGVLDAVGALATVASAGLPATALAATAGTVGSGAGDSLDGEVSTRAGLGYSAAGPASSLSPSSSSAGSSMGDAANASNALRDSTVQKNSVRHFEDIPTEALMSVDELHDLIEQGKLDNREFYLIDIRSHRDFMNIQIEGARNIPAGRQIEIRIDEIPIDREVALIALKNSDRLAETWYTLMDHGYDASLVKVVQGGVQAWVDAGYPVLEDQFLGC